MRRTVLALASAALIAAASLSASPASAGTLDVWTTYPSMGACKGDVVHVNVFCAGLQDGRAIGLIDASLAVDKADLAAHISYTDENALPAPEGPTNPVVEVSNNSGLVAAIGPGASLREDANNVGTIWAVMPGADAAIPATDATVDWNWNRNVNYQHATQNQNGVVNLAANGTFCVALVSILAPANNCPSS